VIYFPENRLDSSHEAAKKLDGYSCCAGFCPCLGGIVEKAGAVLVSAFV
jgi:hypothetical protein